MIARSLQTCPLQGLEPVQQGKWPTFEPPPKNVKVIGIKSPGDTGVSSLRVPGYTKPCKS